MKRPRIPTTFARLCLAGTGLALVLAACESVSDSSYDRPYTPPPPGADRTNEYPAMQAPPQGYAADAVRNSNRQPAGTRTPGAGRPITDDRMAQNRQVPQPYEQRYEAQASMSTQGSMSGQTGISPQTGMSGQAAVPQAPYQDTPSYQSRYGEYWEQSQAPIRDDEIYVTDNRPMDTEMQAGAGMQARVQGSPGVTASQSQPAYQPQPGFQSEPAYQSPPAASSQDYYGGISASSGATQGSAMPQVPEAPDDASTGQATVPVRDADGFPLYPGAAPEVREPYRASGSALPTRPGGASTAQAEAQPAYQQQPATGAPTPTAAPASQPQPMPQSRSQPRPQPGPEPTPSANMAAAGYPAPGMGTAAGGYALHLASYRVRDNAYTGWDVLSRAHGDTLYNLQPRIAAVEIAGLGLHFRLKAGPFATRGEADAACDRIEMSGDYCDVMPFDGDPL